MPAHPSASFIGQCCPRLLPMRHIPASKSMRTRPIRPALSHPLTSTTNTRPPLPACLVQTTSSPSTNPHCHTKACSQSFAQNHTQHRISHSLKNNMSGMSGHSAACCSIPPVVAKGYSPKGDYEDVGGFKTYITGPSTAGKGIISIYDIFGFYPQTLQGADILSTSHATDKFKVFIPDWFHGEPCPLEIFPPDNEDKKKQLNAFFEKNSPPSVAAKVPAYFKAVREKNPEIKSWAILGYCWGGKVAALSIASGEATFQAGASVHPAMVDPSEAEKINIPFCMLGSKDEPAEDVKKFENNLKGPKHVEIFGDQIHGWMGARADLEDKRVLEEYTRGYKTVLEFFAKHT